MLLSLTGYRLEGLISIRRRNIRSTRGVKSRKNLGVRVVFRFCQSTNSLKMGSVMSAFSHGFLAVRRTTIMMANCQTSLPGVTAYPSIKTAFHTSGGQEGKDLTRFLTGQKRHQVALKKITREGNT